MTDQTVDDAFVRLASAHIDLANAQARSNPQELVAVALLHAAARYNAFAGSKVARTGVELQALREDLINDQVQQFRDALEHHYTGYVTELDATPSTAG